MWPERDTGNRRTANTEKWHGGGMHFDGRVGVTGGSSFLGRHLVDRLCALGAAPVLFVGDIRNRNDVYEFLRGVDVVYHLAGANRGQDSQVIEANQSGGTYVADAAVSMGDRSIIFASSTYVERFPSSPYSIGKRGAEHAIEEVCGRRGCSATVVRLSNVYGVGCLPFYVSVVATFCWYMGRHREAEMPISGDGSDVRSFVTVDDAVTALVSAAKRRKPFELTRVQGTDLSIAALANIVRTPAEWDRFPVIGDVVRQHERADQVKAIRVEWASTERNGREVALLLPANSRSVRLSDRSEVYGVQVRTGVAALDSYDEDGIYVQTSLLDGGPDVTYIPPPGSEWRLRSVGGVAAELGLQVR